MKAASKEVTENTWFSEGINRLPSTNHVKERTIVNHRSRHLVQQLHLHLPAIQDRHVLLLPHQNFHFVSYVFFCCENASDEYIQNQKKCRQEFRQAIRIVTDDSTIDTILKANLERSDDYGAILFDRIGSQNDLIAKAARYHASCFLDFTSPHVAKKRGRPLDPKVASCFEFVKDFIIENKEECQFSLDEILQQFQGEIPSVIRIVQKLEDYFGNNIIISKSGKGTIISCKSLSKKIVTDAFYKNRSKDEEQERKRIVECAAKIIAEDIRSKVYDINEYPAPDNFLQNVDSVIPETLKIFLHSVISKEKKNPELSEKKILAISHCIVSATRSRSFISTFQLGLAAMLHKQYGSKHLLDALSKVGFCSSYNDVLMFEASVLQDSQVRNLSDSYVQFVYDNADHNTNTIDGLKTFHSMGGIMCVTPSLSIECNKTVQKLKKMPSASSLGSFGFVPLSYFERKNSEGLKKIV